MNWQPDLNGELVRLRPLKETDFENLFQAAADPLIWELHPQPTRYQRGVFQTFFEGAIQSGGALLIQDAKTAETIGSSRFYNWLPQKQEVTIGYTFLKRSHWGGIVNLELKRLMLGHAFQFAKSAAFEIGIQNLRSRRAIEKIGATLDEELMLDGKTHVIYRIFR